MNRRRLRRVIAAPPNNSPSNLRVLCDHLHLPKARQVEVKARIIAMTFAVNSTCFTKRRLQQMQKSMKQVAQQLCFYTILAWFCGYGGLPEAAAKAVPNKTPKDQRSQSILGGYFGPFWFPNPIFVHFVCSNFYACFWHRSWEASGSNFNDFGVISGCLLGSFRPCCCRCCKTQKMQPFHMKSLVWEVLGLRFCIIFANFLNVFFMLLSRRPFCSILAELGLQKGSLLGYIFRRFCKFWI